MSKRSTCGLFTPPARFLSDNIPAGFGCPLEFEALTQILACDGVLTPTEKGSTSKRPVGLESTLSEPGPT